MWHYLVQMEEKQAATFDVSQKEVDAVNVVFSDDEKLQQQQFIDFCALGGLLTDEAGNFTRLTLNDFAEMIQVDRVTLWRWKKAIPYFDQKVRERRIVISKGTRASKVYNGLYLKACKGDPAAVRLWAEIFDGYQPAPQRIQHNLGNGFADAAGIARKRREQAVEGEVVDEQPND